jgi:hypothetical protein
MQMVLESVRDLPAEYRQWVPSLEARMYLPAGGECRLLALVNGATMIPVWVAISEVTDSGYVGHTVDNYGTSEVAIPLGTRFEFTADHVIEN